jgi:hypothetical protein
MATNKCQKCGCEDTFLTSPAPCPTPEGCPSPEPCSEVFNAQCVIYTGDVLTSGITVEEAIDEIAPAYRVYTAIITQSGTNPPTVTVLQNTIGTISFEYNGVGLYSAVSAGLFIEGKTFAFIGTSPDTNSHAVIASSGGGNNSARAIQTSISGVYSNNVLSGSALEIRVYN